MLVEACGALALVHRRHDWSRLDAERPYFVCAEMFLGLRDVESRRTELWRLREDLRRSDRPVATLAEFLLPEDVAWLEATAARIAHEWYRDEGRDWSEYRGVSLGRCCEYDVKAQSIRLLKFALTCRRAVARFPGRPVFSDYPAAAPEARLLDALGIATTPFDAGDSHAHGPSRSALSLRSRVVGMARSAALRAFGIASRARRAGGADPRPVVVVRPSFQSMEMLARWATERTPRVRVALWMTQATRPRTLLSLLRAGATLVEQPAADEPAVLHELERVRANWQGEGRRLRVAESTGLPLQAALEELCAPFVERDMVTHARAVDQAFRTLGDRAVTTLAIPNDCQGLMRAWTLVAKRTGTRTLVLQHGHLDYTEDEDHLVADYSAFWSDAVCRQFLLAGLEPRQMLLTGSPNADVYLRRTAPVAGQSAGGRPRALVITTGNPGVQAYVDEVWVVDYIARVLTDLCDGSGRFEVAVRLHPGESTEAYQEYARPWLGQISALGDGGRLADWLSNCDVVISPPSTVVLEARAAGLPVILLPIHSVDGRPTSLREVRGVVTLRETDSVADAVERVMAGETEHPANGNLASFVGPLDGDAALRLLRAMEQVALGEVDGAGAETSNIAQARAPRDAVAGSR